MPVKVEYALRETLTNIRRQIFMTLAVVLVVAVSLYLIGGVLLLRYSVNRAIELRTHNVEVSVFLTNDITDDLRNQIERDITEMEEVAPGGVIFETREEALRRFKELWRDNPELWRDLDPSAMPESFRVKLKDPKQFTVVRDRLEGRPGVDTITDEREFLREFFKVVDDIGRVGWVLVGLLTSAGALLIGTTIRLAIFNRRREIGIMKLVGATNWFIRVPFMLEGILHGVTGAALSVLLLVVTRPFFTKVAANLQAVQITVSYGDILRHGMFLLLAGIFIGAVGSMFGLRRFLDV